MYYVVSPQTYHTERFDDYGEILFIGFGHIHKEIIPQNGVYRTEDMSTLMYFRTIIDEYKQQNAEYKIAAGAFLDLLLVSTLRNRNNASRKYKDIEYIKTYIEQYSNQKINFAQLADVAKLVIAYPLLKSGIWAKNLLHK